MNQIDLIERLGATTLFSHLPGSQLADLIERSPKGRKRAGEWVVDSAHGLKDHLVLLCGELEARRTWTEADGSERSSVWRVAVNADGPGFSLLSAASRRISVQAIVDSEYLSIDSEELDDFLGWSDLSGNSAMARNLKLFHKIPLENVQRAFECMVERPVAAGETIVTQGEPGDSYYIILSGDAEVWVTDPLSDETARVAVLSDADAFGEEALLLEGNRTATVKMISPGRLLVLSKADFDQLVKSEMVEVIDAESANAMLRGRSVGLLDCRYDVEYEESRIPGAQLVPLDKLRREGVFSIDPKHTYIVYCRSGRRSKAAAFLLRERGIRALSLNGGIKEWPYEVDSGAVR